jgi:hypothetical protein
MVRWLMILVLTGVAVACGGGTAGNAAPGSQEGGVALSSASASSSAREFHPIPSILVDPPAPPTQ